MLLDGIGIASYRSFGKSGALLPNCQKINVLMGQNNSGKSNILNFIYRALRASRDVGEPEGVDASNTPYGTQDHDQMLGIMLRRGSDFSEAIFNEIARRTGRPAAMMDQAKDMLFNGRSEIWLYHQIDRHGRLMHSAASLQRTAEGLSLPDRHWQQLMGLLAGMSGGALDSWKKACIEALSPTPLNELRMDVIPAIRTLRTVGRRTEYPEESKGERKSGSDHSGIGLIDELFQLKNAPYGREQDLRRFEQINQFMRDITENSSVTLEVPHTRDTVLVNMDGKRLPIERLGSGVEELLIMAAKSTIFSNQVVGIEEPELHLHPSLQRKFFRYLYIKTDNQYFITTHSSCLLDVVPCGVYHVRIDGEGSAVEHVLSDQRKFGICADLGYQASDLLQANCVVWVEGPSDRIYLNHWLQSALPDLVEGLHYSVMFYGGRLLSRLSAADESVSDFISLRSLNRNICILMDSDRCRRGARLNDTKRRIRREIEEVGGLVWVTAGREIENYIPSEVLDRAVKAIYGSDSVVTHGDSFADVTKVWRRGRKVVREEPIDKMRLATLVATEPSALDVLDLERQVARLSEYILSCNETAVGARKEQRLVPSGG